jgi:GNAT superfamily N-acetyltransferase
MHIVYKEGLPSKDAFSKLFETTGWNRTYQASREELEEAIGKSWRAVSAYDDQELVGFGRALSDGVLYANIVDLIVIPSHQGKGVGSAILKRLVELCQAAGVRDIQLFSAAGTTGFYKKHGFVERPEDAPGMRLSRNSATFTRYFRRQ